MEMIEIKKCWKKALFSNSTFGVFIQLKVTKKTQEMFVLLNLTLDLPNIKSN